MSLFSKKTLVVYAGELLVIVVGILVAFQVEEWRDGLKQQRDLQASLARLREEAEFNLELCAKNVPLAERIGSYSLAVVDALQSGQILPGQQVDFELGLTGLGALYAPPYISTVAEEMISTGILRELDHAGLRKEIASLPRLVARVVNDYASQRQAMSVAVNELARRVAFVYEGSTDFATTRGLSGRNIAYFEDAIAVDYDFAALAADTYFKNLAIEVADTHGDLYSVQHELCAANERAHEMLTASMAL